MERDVSRPEPLSRPDCDLRGLEWMPLNAANLMDSDLFLLSTGDEFKAAMALICKSWRQVPAGSLPSDDNALATLAGARDWTMVRTMALRNWVLCSDGRLYHPIVAAKAMEALPHREEFVAKKSAEADRKKRERDDRKRLFHALRDAGIVLPFDTKTTELRQQFKRLQPVDNPPGGEPVTPIVTPSDRDNQSRDNRDTSRLGHHTTPHDKTVGEENPPKPPRKRRGNPDLVTAEQLVAEGVSEQHARDWLAVRAKKDLPLTVTALDGVREEAGKAGITLGQAVKTAAENSWGGFKAKWLQPDGASSASAPTGGNRQEALEQRISNVAQSWAEQKRQEVIDAGG